MGSLMAVLSSPLGLELYLWIFDMNSAFSVQATQLARSSGASEILRHGRGWFCLFVLAESERPYQASLPVIYILGPGVHKHWARGVVLTDFGTLGSFT